MKYQMIMVAALMVFLVRGITEGAGVFYSTNEICSKYTTGYSTYDYTTRTFTTDKFELLHADFHGHIAQYIHAMIPAAYRNSAEYRLVAGVKSTTGYKKELFNKSILGTEVKVLLQNGTLPQGNYTLTARIMDGKGAAVKEITETFAKPYDGIPRIGINEHKAICVEGKPFFPITPFGMMGTTAVQWLRNGYINSLCRGGWWQAAYDVPEMKAHLDFAQQQQSLFIGPETWDGKHADLIKVAEYVNTLKDHPGLFMWLWDDEPNLGGPAEYFNAKLVRSWTEKCHELDPHHLVYTNMAGKALTVQHQWYVQRRGEYAYLINEDDFGGRKTAVADVQAFDYYPIDWAVDEWGDDATIEKLMLAIRNFRSENYDLFPFMYWIETCNIKEGNNLTPDPPTPEQLRMLCWLHVVMEAKGVQWFHHHTATPAENLDVMAEFSRQIKELTPVVLGPRPDIIATDDANSPGKQVELMVREYEGTVYVIAVRVSEVPEKDDPPVDVSITVEGITGSQAEVYEEGRSVAVSGNTFTDSFAPNAVHIYTIKNQTPVYLPGRKMRQKNTDRPDGYAEFFDLNGRSRGRLRQGNGKIKSGIYFVRSNSTGGYKKLVVVQ